MPHPDDENSSISRWLAEADPERQTALGHKLQVELLAKAVATSRAALLQYGLQLSDHPRSDQG